MSILRRARCAVVWCANGAFAKCNGRDAFHLRMQNWRAVCVDAPCVLREAHVCGGRGRPHHLLA